VSDFDIYLDTDNELKFTVAIEGAHEADVRSQFIVEGPRGISFCFTGKASGSEVAVDVPSLKGLLREGIYNTRLEVIVDDRVFTPLQMQATLKPAIKVEAVVRTAQKVGAPIVTAAVVNHAKPLVETVPVAPAPAPLKQAQPATATTPAPRPVRKQETAPAPVTPRPAAQKPVVRTFALDSLLDSLEVD